MEVVRATMAHLDEVMELLAEYYASVEVIQTDTAAAVKSFLTGQTSGFWIAYLEGVPAGCVVLRSLSPKAGECKRLYVKPHFRRMGVAEALLDVMEEHAEAVGLDSIFLDSKDDLRAAIRIYKKRGYETCDRYNDNPQATIFLRKSLHGAI